ncbi:MAG: DUF4240 domain-containing protein [Bacteroidota bacterium]
MKQFDIANLEKSAEMLDEEQFWNIISTSLAQSQSDEEQEELLVGEIAKLSPKEMIGFRLRTDKLLHDTYNSEMWCAGYIIGGGCSDDGFEYFRNWIISRGKEVYYRAKENPDTLAQIVAQEVEELDFEGFGYVAIEAFGRKTGKDLSDYIDYEVFTNEEGSYPQVDFNWNEREPESMKALCPQLFEKLWARNISN